MMQVLKIFRKAFTKKNGLYYILLFSISILVILKIASTEYEIAVLNQFTFLAVPFWIVVGLAVANLLSIFVVALFSPDQSKPWGERFEWWEQEMKPAKTSIIKEKLESLYILSLWLSFNFLIFSFFVFLFVYGSALSILSFFFIFLAPAYFHEAANNTFNKIKKYWKFASMIKEK